MYENQTPSTDLKVLLIMLSWYAKKYETLITTLKMI